MKKIGYIILLSIVFIVDLLGIYFDKIGIRIYSKPLLIPIIALIYYQLNKTESLSNNKLFLTGLFFSFLGDVFLLKDSGFLYGLASFLLAHIFYIICFYRIKSPQFSLVKLLPIAIYLAVFISLFWSHLGEMKIPVIVYASAISVMLYFSLGLKNKYINFGAFFFVISDTILAHSIFFEYNVYKGLAVMITYIIAQVCLAYGIYKIAKYQGEIQPK
ncbi:lysoplasmalogenase [Riemerella anatipestifer]|nr:lysoplasmalogenase [Riemerella anatipestifer]MDY3532348.1 lysoplasmalogenase [Riemerella anatipestifer]MDY3535097.1 lysoplasmalogenase [Riemerella anatipestifer]